VWVMWWQGGKEHMCVRCRHTRIMQCGLLQWGTGVDAEGVVSGLARPRVASLTNSRRPLLLLFGSFC
jgi:hypothetical protein